LTKSETIPSSPSTSTNIIPNRTSSTTTPSNGTPSKQSKQTPILQPRSQSPSAVPHDQSPKITSTRITTSREPVDNLESPTVVTKTKTPISPTEQVVRPILTTPVVQKKIKSEEKPKPIEIVPKFYFPNGQNTPTSTNDTTLIKQLRQVKEELFLPKQDKLFLEDFGKLSQVEILFSIFI
jgi:hypothetical protein